MQLSSNCFILKEFDTEVSSSIQRQIFTPGPREKKPVAVLDIDSHPMLLVSKEFQRFRIKNSMTAAPKKKNYTRDPLKKKKSTKDPPKKKKSTRPLPRKNKFCGQKFDHLPRSLLVRP